jgi:outer membrane protein assembly factor BamB
MDDPNRILASAGYGRGGGVVELTSVGGKVDTKEIYFTDKIGNRHGGIIRVGQHVYGDLDDSGRIWCAEAKTGKIMWTRKDDSEGGGSASITFADGMLYVRFHNVWISLVEANPKAYKMVSTFRVPNGTGNCWAHPVVVGGKFYVREKDMIWCYDVAMKK